MLLRKELINLELVQKILLWQHTGFNVHSKVRTRTREEAERVGKMLVIAFIEDPKIIDKIIDHLKLTFIAEHPPPSQAQPQLAVAAEDRVEYI